VKVLHIHNRYRYVGGEDVMFDHITAMLERRGHRVLTFMRHSKEIKTGSAKLKAFFSSLHNFRSARALARLLASERPEIAHIHNLYPLISPAVLPVCRRFGVPVVMRIPDYRFSCPTNWHFNGKVCEACSDGREWWCLLKNCRNNLGESFAYAARSFWARRRGLFRKFVDWYVPPSRFVRERMIQSGFPEERIVVIPNMTMLPDRQADPYRGAYAAYVGRVSPEKGPALIVEAARRTGIPVRIAGDWSRMPELVESAPPNVKFLGQVDRRGVAELLQGARFAVVPTLGWEAFGIASVEAMSYGLPVIASRVGGIPEVVKHGVCGLLFRPGDLDELAGRMRELWRNPEACARMGSAGRKRVRAEYSEEAYYGRLIGLYERALAAVG